MEVVMVDKRPGEHGEARDRAALHSPEATWPDRWEAIERFAGKSQERTDWYVSATYRLTGEEKRLSAPVVPTHPFAPIAGK